MNGYMHPYYAESLGEYGTPFLLQKSRGWILERQIPNLPYYDAMGCYPLFTCRDWSQLWLDLDNAENFFVSLAVVTDPFGDYDLAYLRECFKDVVTPFKEHYIIEYSKPLNLIISKHHRYYASKALSSVEVEVCSDPTCHLEEWINLYTILIQRHDLKGIKSFSRASFEKQLRIPGMVMFRAVHEGAVAGIHLWYVQGEVGYSHLTALSPLGYNLMASYALYWTAINYFSEYVCWLDLGGGAGIDRGGTDGLCQFKRGWSNESRTAYFCGRIFNPALYSEACSLKSISEAKYFPAYRAGDFS